MNKMVEWEVTLNCNFNCDYCGLLRPIKPELNEEKIYNFIKELNKKYSNIEIFVFGGEPFLHPKIDFIIRTLQSFKQPFVIQSNLSNKSTSIIKKIYKSIKPFKIFISVHVSQISIGDICKNINLINKINPIKEIHLMYTETSGKVENAYKLIDLIKGNSELILTPISNLACSGYTDILLEYDKIKENFNYDKNTVIFEGKEYLRSDIWIKQNSSKKSLTKGKPCLYKDKYILYNPALQENNCCYRKKTDGICAEQNCFFM